MLPRPFARSPSVPALSALLYRLTPGGEARRVLSAGPDAHFELVGRLR